jgi:hypothetical protein
MTNPVELSEPEIGLVSGGILEQSVSISATQSSTSTLVGLVSASSNTPVTFSTTLNTAAVLSPMAVDDVIASALVKAEANALLTIKSLVASL